MPQTWTLHVEGDPTGLFAYSRLKWTNGVATTEEQDQKRTPFEIRDLACNEQVEFTLKEITVPVLLGPISAESFERDVVVVMSRDELALEMQRVLKRPPTAKELQLLPKSVMFRLDRK